MNAIHNLRLCMYKSLPYNASYDECSLSFSRRFNRIILKGAIYNGARNFFFRIPAQEQLKYLLLFTQNCCHSFCLLSLYLFPPLDAPHMSYYVVYIPGMTWYKRYSIMTRRIDSRSRIWRRGRWSPWSLETTTGPWPGTRRSSSGTWSTASTGYSRFQRHADFMALFKASTTINSIIQLGV